MKIFVILLLFFSFKNFKCEVGQFLLYKYKFIMLNYTIEFNNFEVHKSYRYKYFDLWAKLCFALSYSDYEKNCVIKYKGYSFKWV